MSSVSFVSALLGVVLVTLACQEPDKHPPLISPCDPGQRCSLGVGQLGGAAMGGSTGAGGSSTAGTAGSGSGRLTGSVVDLVDDGFVASIPFGDSAIIEGQASNGAVLSTTFNGQAPFTLLGVEPAVPSWISVRPSNGTGNLRTLHPVATNIDRSVELGLVRADTLDEMFGVLTVPAQLATATAQIVLAFTVTQGASTSGAVGVQVALPDSAFVAYKSGAVWSSDLPGTDSSGLAVLGNVPGVAFPGTTKRIFLGGSSSGFIDVRVAADAVSLVAVPLSP